MKRYGLASALLGLCWSCSASPKPQGAPATIAPPPAQVERVGARAAMHEAAAYLQRHLDAEGRFDYLRRSSTRESKYNVLRHAGAIYALAQFYQYDPSPELAAAIVRASRYLKRRYLRAPKGHEEMLAIFSLPVEEGNPPGTAKLGGAGLGLIALCYAQQLDPSLVSKEELQAIARFIVFMQKEDGSFHSKYEEGRGYNTEFHSLYYPGEAMLGLATLYELDGDSEWLDVALASAERLVASREEGTRWPADHWMMLASTPLLARFDSSTSPAISATDLADHIAALGTLIMDQQRMAPPAEQAQEAGSFGRGARATPAATRLEGLSALLVNQRAAGTLDNARLELSIRTGLGFLQRCQIMDDSAERGGMPHSCAADAGAAKRDREVRIDYVQHYLSAMLSAQALGLFDEGP